MDTMSEVLHTILKTYRFEGESDPAGQAIFYLLKANDGTIGHCIDAYGFYSSHANDLCSDLLVRRRSLLLLYQEAYTVASSINPN